jgi:hypothetical protein
MSAVGTMSGSSVLSVSGGQHLIGPGSDVDGKVVMTEVGPGEGPDRA